MLKKFMLTFHKLYKKIIKIKIIKALIGLITVVMSYKTVNYFFKFNKLIIYLFGLIFVGFNWNDYHVLNEIKLIWDSVILYILSYLPNNEITDDIKDSTKKDMKEIINYKDHTNINGKIDDDYVYVIAEKFEEVKNIKKESYITDGNENCWTFNEILSNPLVIFAIVSAITISGLIILNIYDPNLEVTKTYIFDHIKTGFTATLLFIGKIIKFFKGNNGRPPINPNNPDLPINPLLNLDKKTVVFGPEKPPFFDTIQNNQVLKSNENIIEKITEINKHIKDLSMKPSTSNNRKIEFLNNKINELKKSFIDINPDSPISDTGSNTPKAFKSPLMDNTNLPNFIDD